MALRQWMVPHEWMVKPMLQTEWIDRKGILVWIAEVFTSLGAGLYLVSIFFGSWWGMLVAWVLVMCVKIPLHILYFGKPLRFWRTMVPFSKAWKTSWYTRGIMFNVVFGSLVVIQLIISWFAIYAFPEAAGWHAWDIGLRAISGIFAFLVGIYSGLIMCYCRSIPFWNTAMLPLILIIAGIGDGFALMLAVGLADSSVSIAAAEAGSRVLLSVNIVLIALYLWNATYTSKTAKYSSMLMVKGFLAPHFWVGLVICGMILPLIIAFGSYAVEEMAAPLLILAIFLHTVGAVFFKYILLKAGAHNPIIPATTSAYH